VAAAQAAGTIGAEHVRIIRRFFADGSRGGRVGDDQRHQRNHAAGVRDQSARCAPKVVDHPDRSGLRPGVLLVNPVDWEACELALSTMNSIDHQGLPSDASARRLFGVPVVVSNAQAAGGSQAVGQGAIGLDVDGRVQIDWSENATADSFARNEVVARCEGRYACSVFRPGAIVKGELTA
jgi:hypothetical protein